MRRNFTLLVLSMIFAVAAANGQSEKPAQAAVVLNAALQEAGGANKTVLLIFHASWCGWCKRLDAALENPVMKNIMKDHYIITHLDVMESGVMKDRKSVV
jgi:thioredoxin-related protein